MNSIDARISITLVEDDERLATLVSRYLREQGLEVTEIGHAKGAVEQIRGARPDLVILDLGLPDEDGLSICQQLRPDYTAPILVLTARDNSIDHVLALELGADDFVVKPIEPRVLLARINALLRRARPVENPSLRALQFGALVIDPAARTVRLQDKHVSLSSSEFELLYVLAAHAGEVQSRSALFEHLYRRQYDGIDRVLDIRISRLRRKLGDDADRSERIKTVWGHGYLFVPNAW
ncbi:MAG TPA: response regulator [Steroidobacteraceae bacterium]